MGIYFFKYDNMLSATVEKYARIILNGKDGCIALKTLQDKFEHILAGSFAIDLMRDMIVIRWDLHCDLSTWQQLVKKIGDQFRMIFCPLQGGVAENEVPFARPLGLISQFKAQIRACEGSGLF